MQSFLMEPLLGIVVRAHCGAEEMKRNKPVKPVPEIQTEL